MIVEPKTFDPQRRAKLVLDTMFVHLAKVLGLEYERKYPKKVKSDFSTRAEFIKYEEERPYLKDAYICSRTKKIIEKLVADTL